jgi:ribosomal protein L37AE/L43A
MNRQTQTCPCCDNSLLRHIRHGKIYWFCTHCWQEVPLLAIEQTPTLESNNLETNISEAIAVSEGLGVRS